MSSKRIAFTVQGHVQGVNFRSSTQKRASGLGLTGFVINVSDGTVQGEAQGSPEAIDELVHHLHHGPAAASVTHVKQSDVAVKAGENGFRVQ